MGGGALLVVVVLLAPSTGRPVYHHILSAVVRCRGLRQPTWHFIALDRLRVQSCVSLRTVGHGAAGLGSWSPPLAGLALRGRRGCPGPLQPLFGFAETSFQRLKLFALDRDRLLPGMR